VQPVRVRPLHGIGLLAGYLAATWVAMFLLEPGITPPGFTPGGACGVLIAILGAYHAAASLPWPRIFFPFGCLAAILLLPSFLDDHRVGYSLSSGHTTVAEYTTAWIAFVLASGLAARAAANLRLRVSRGKRMRTNGGLCCAGCGYDLTGNVSGVCPECGMMIPK
jgi:hypothetical protein